MRVQKREMIESNSSYNVYGFGYAKTTENLNFNTVCHGYHVRTVVSDGQYAGFRLCKHCGNTIMHSCDASAFGLYEYCDDCYVKHYEQLDIEADLEYENRNNNLNALSKSLNLFR